MTSTLHNPQCSRQGGDEKFQNFLLRHGAGLIQNDHRTHWADYVVTLYLKVQKCQSVRNHDFLTKKWFKTCIFENIDGHLHRVDQMLDGPVFSKIKCFHKGISTFGTRWQILEQAAVLIKWLLENPPRHYSATLRLLDLQKVHHFNVSKRLI